MTCYVRTLDRRTVLRWMGAALASDGFLYGCTSGDGSDKVAEQSVTPGAGPIGYGTDPDMNDPVVPWPATLTGPQLDTLAALCDVLLPAAPPHPSASQCAVPEFIDEWVSAPYPDQAIDRRILLRGLEWAEQQAMASSRAPFAALPPERQAALVAQLAVEREPATADAWLADFFARLRRLTFGAYYTTPAGAADLGFPGERPVTGDYPGPTHEAMRHMENALHELGLEPGWKADATPPGAAAWIATRNKA